MRSSKWMLETSLPHIPTAEENLPAPLSNDGERSAVLELPSILNNQMQK